jgi:hypothetical protein
MPEFLTAPFRGGPDVAPLQVFVRLILALLFGGLVAFVYRRTRSGLAASHSFTTTLVLLAVLIAMVTQVIGDNVARAFSLVGALSIVRFRTVVRDTQDTAYVIFAVAVGMAVGANDPWVALIGIVVIGVAAFLMKTRSAPGTGLEGDLPFVLHVRVGLGHDVHALLGATLDRHLSQRELLGMATTKQGVAIEVSYRAALQSDRSAHELVSELNRLEGVHNVALQRADADEAGV